MADTKISALANGAPLQTGDDIPIARGGANFRLPGSAFVVKDANGKISITDLPPDIAYYSVMGGL